MQDQSEQVKKIIRSKNSELLQIILDGVPNPLFIIKGMLELLCCDQDTFDYIYDFYKLLKRVHVNITKEYTKDYEENGTVYYIIDYKPDTRLFKIRYGIIKENQPLQIMYKVANFYTGTLMLYFIGKDEEDFVLRKTSPLNRQKVSDVFDSQFIFAYTESTREMLTKYYVSKYRQQISRTLGKNITFNSSDIVGHYLESDEMYPYVITNPINEEDRIKTREANQRSEDEKFNTSEKIRRENLLGKFMDMPGGKRKRSGKRTGKRSIKRSGKRSGKRSIKRSGKRNIKRTGKRK